MSTPSEILLRAAEVLERDGWTQGASTCGRKRCAMTAIGDADGRIEERERLRAVIGSNSIVDWNDAPGRTASEVIAAMREAARHGL